jgi:anti-anti-sigma factor
MKYYMEDHGLTAVLYLKDDLSFRDIEELGSLLSQVVRETTGSVIVDMADVGSVDSSITGQFVAAQREAKTHRRDLVLSRVSNSVRSAFHAGHADNLVQIFRTTEEAIAELADRTLGGETRKVVANIKCGHDDCVFYTYTKLGGVVVPACQYPYPDEITNGPNCRCYRVNWSQRKWDSQQIESPFQKGKKRSLYEVRDKAAQGLEPPAGLPPMPEQGADERAPMNLAPHPAPAIPGPEAYEYSSSPGQSMSLDPFADDNFPSAQTPHWVDAAPPQAKAPPKPHPRTEITIEPPKPVRTAPRPPSKPAKKPPGRAPMAPVSDSLPANEISEEKPPSPEDVVRSYLESWNTSRFVDEYNCLAKKNRTLPVEDYCARRKAVKTQQVHAYRKYTIQEIGRVDSVSIEGDHANVEITRVDRTPFGTRCYAEFFTLVREDGAWRIRMSEDGEERRNPIAPPKNRIMKAGEFFGKERGLRKRPAS